MPGKIHLYMGPMFSGKTSEIMRQFVVLRLSLSKKGDSKPILFVRNAKDNRYCEDSAATHDGMRLNDCENVVAVHDLRDVIERAKPCSHVFIDEGQLFTGLKDICVRWAREGKKIVISCLDAHSDHPAHSPWYEIQAISPFASKVVKLTARCFVCGDKAPLTMSLFTADGPVEVIGHTDKYYASCLACADDGTRPKTSSMSNETSVRDEATVEALKIHHTSIARNHIRTPLVTFKDIRTVSLLTEILQKGVTPNNDELLESLSKIAI